MALYQFVIEFLPSRWAKENKNASIELLYCNDTEEYDTSIAWESLQVPTEFNFLASEILPPTKSWHEDLAQWGENEKHDIQLWTEGSTIESIKIRLDLRENTDNIKTKIINLAKQLDYILFIPELKCIIDPKISELNKKITKSESFKFSENPEKFLNK